MVNSWLKPVFSKITRLFSSKHQKGGSLKNVQMHRIPPVVSNFLKFSSTVVAVQWNCEASHEVQTQRLDEYFDLGRLLNGGDL